MTHQSPLPPKIMVAGEENKEQLLSSLMLAFSADPFHRWLMPQAHQYVENYAAFTTALAGLAFTHNTAFYAEGFSAASLWLPPGVSADEDEVGAMIVNVAPEPLLEIMGNIGVELEKFHPEHCWYLAVLGVDATYQGQGLGALMLQDQLRRCDEEGVPAYLESSNPANISLYQRHGFEVMGEVSIGNPVLTPMIREPR